jgi:replicative DNA helicase
MHHLEELYNSIGNALDLQTFDNFVLDDLILNTVENLYAKDNVIPFGIDNIDKMVGGMTRGEISIIAGRPGHFKSTMMINVVSNLIQQGYKVLVMNREMSNIEMMKKFMVMEAKHITYDVFRAGTYSKEHKEELKKIVEVIRNKYKNLIMYDNIMDLSGAMREIRKHKPDVVVDDYIGLVNVKGIDDNRLKIDSIMKQYKWACKNNNMCALLLSQLNRKCEERTNKRPLPSDLRESGSIEQDAEMILFMYYEWRYLERESTLGEYGLEVVIGKNRYGRTGSVIIGVSGNKCKMYETPDIALASSILKEKK